MRILCLSDLHGHAEALGAVLAAAERSGYDKLLVAGDLCFPGPEPLATWRRLTQAGAACVQGVGDRALATIDPATLHPRSAHERARLDRLAEVRRELGDLILARLARLPETLRLPLDDGGELFLVHGSPVDPTEPITHDMSDAEVSALLGDDPADIVVCGGSHVAFDRVVAGVRIVNVGSVGEAPRGLAPYPHADATLIEVTRPRPQNAPARPARSRPNEARTPTHAYPEKYPAEGTPPGKSVGAGAPTANSTDNVKVTQLAVPLGKAA